MNYIKISPYQDIQLKAQNDATPTQAINAAIEFVNDNMLKGADLDYFGYRFGIEPNSDIKALVADYSYCQSQKK